MVSSFAIGAWFGGVRISINEVIKSSTAVITSDGAFIAIRSSLIISSSINACSKLFCNTNGNCDGFENYKRCPSDCNKHASDNLCINGDDGICDPDCKETDVDCVCDENEICSTKSEPKSEFPIIMAIVLLGLIGWLSFILIRKK